MTFVISANSLTNDLEKIHQWSNKWAVEFNPIKTVNMDFSRKNISYPWVKFGQHGPFIQNVETHTHLRIIFQRDGCWKNHIHHIHNKACQRLNVLKYQLIH